MATDTVVSFWGWLFFLSFLLIELFSFFWVGRRANRRRFSSARVADAGVADFQKESHVRLTQTDTHGERKRERERERERA